MQPVEKRLAIGCGTAAGLGLIGIVVLLFWLGSGPTSGVKLGNEMDPYALDYIAEHELLNPGEEIIAYYDVTIAMDGTEAAILTTHRLIYHKQGNTVAIPIEEIEDVRHRTETLTGDIFEIESTSGQVMKIEIAPLNQGETFKNVLMAAWEKRRDNKEQ